VAGGASAGAYLRWAEAFFHGDENPVFACLMEAYVVGGKRRQTAAMARHKGLRGRVLEVLRKQDQHIIRRCRRPIAMATAWCSYVTAQPTPVLSTPSSGATLVKRKDLGNGIEILPLPHPPGWWPVSTPRNHPDRNWMPAGVLSPRVAGTRPCPDNNAIAAVTVTNSDSAEEQFVIGSDCRIYHRWQMTAGGQFSPWSGMGGCASGHHGLAVGMNADGELVAFVISPDHEVRYKSQSRPSLGPWTSWASIRGDVFAGLRVVSAASGSSPIRVFASDKSGGLWENDQAAAGEGKCCWSGWHKIQSPSPGPS